MKKRGFLTSIRQGGALHWSTLCLLAGGAGLTGCDSGYTATEQDARMVELQTRLDDIDARKASLMNGEVANNFELPGVGFYHAAARDFFPYAYGFQKDGKWFANGAWQDAPVAEAAVPASRPTPAALRKVELALAREQELLAQAPVSGTTTHHHQSSGMGTALMMYWLLAGNRGAIAPGAGFQQAGTQAATWQRQMAADRQTVSKYAASNPGYRRMVEQSRATGRPVRAGESVRGGFGTSGKSRTSSGS